MTSVESAIPGKIPTMKAVRIHRFGGPDVITCEDVPRPRPLEGQVVVRVMAAGVGPWDAWVRAGRSAIAQSLPLIPGSDISGVIDEIGPGVADLRPGDEVYGVTNKQFTGAYAELAAACASMIARKPHRLDHVHAASVPVVACTAWQMLFDHGHLASGRKVLIHGAAGNVGRYAVQLARRAGAWIAATGRGKDGDLIRELGADLFIDVGAAKFEDAAGEIDLVIDTVGGETLERSFAVLRRGGTLVSAVAPPDQDMANRLGVTAAFFLVSITSEDLRRLAELLDSGELTTCIGEVMPLSQARTAHEMLAGKPHKDGKIVLKITD